MAGMAQWTAVLANNKLDGLSGHWDPYGGERERTNSCKLSSNLNDHIVANDSQTLYIKNK